VRLSPDEESKDSNSQTPWRAGTPGDQLMEVAVLGYIVFGVVVVGCMFLWLVYCLVQSLLHGAEKGVHVIKATGMYFPLRGKMPKFRLPRWPGRKT
jgi:hypothetical protein